MARPRTDIEPRIVSAAAARFAESGVEAASLRSIAKDAGTSIGMVYYYFPTKDDLFFAVVEEVYARLLDELTLATKTDGAFADRIAALYTRIGALRPDEKTILRLVALEAFTGSPRFLRLIERFRRGHIGLMFQLVAEGVQSGSFRQDVEPFAIVASIAAIGVMPQVFLQLGGPHLPMVPKIPNEALVAQLVDVLFRGIGRRSEP